MSRRGHRIREKISSHFRGSSPPDRCGPASSSAMVSPDYPKIPSLSISQMASSIKRQKCFMPCRNRRSPLGGRTTAAAWHSKPSWYAVSKQDQTINPDLERFLAKRMNATTVDLDAGHL